MKFLVPKSMLPEDEHERFDRLHSYFCDQRANSELTDAGWLIKPYWPATPEYFADPSVCDGITWWLPGLALNRIHFEVRQKDTYQLSLNDSWTAFAWSQWLARRGENDIGKVTILHVDYHKDLMSPRLMRTETGFQDILRGVEFHLNDPEAVKASILSGAIGVGSFMTPFLHGLPNVEIRHLCKGRSRDHGVPEWHLDRILTEDDFLQPEAKRPAVSFCQPGSLTKDFIVYRVTDAEDEWLEGVSDGPILLHIDMDYFNCRFDGDSGWQNDLPRFDPPFEDQERSMRRLFDAIVARGLHQQVEDVAVALSPGFFPVEFWQPMIQLLEANLTRLKSGTA